MLDSHCSGISQMMHMQGVKLEGEDEVAQCTKCNTVPFIAEAKYLLAANFTLKTTSEERIHVRAYGTILYCSTYLILKTARR